MVLPLLMAATLLAQVPANSSAPTAEEVSAWLQAERKAALEWPYFGEYSFHWWQENNDPPDPNRIAALRKEIGSAAEHPMKAELKRLEDRQRKGPTRIEFGVFLDGTGGWRYNRTFDDGVYLDAVLTKKTSWNLWPTSLKVFEPALSSPEHGGQTEQNQSSTERDVRGAIGTLVHGGLDFDGDTGFVIGSPTIRGQQWKAKATRAESGTPKIEYELSGRWDSSVNRGFIETKTLVLNQTKPAVSGFREEFSDWARDKATGVWTAGRVEERMPDGSWFIRRGFVGTRPWPATFATLTTPPTAGGEDHVRGKSTFSTLYDYRTNRAHIFGADGSVSEATMNVPIGKPTREWLRIFGWTAFGTLCVLLGLVVRRRLRGEQV